MLSKGSKSIIFPYLDFDLNQSSDFIIKYQKFDVSEYESYMKEVEIM
jgi:hypothetical protein